MLVGPLAVETKIYGELLFFAATALTLSQCEDDFNWLQSRNQLLRNRGPERRTGIVINDCDTHHRA